MPIITTNTLSCDVEGESSVIRELNDIFQTLIDSYGPWGAIAIVLFFWAGTVVYRVYNARRKDRETNEALKEKEKTIRYMAQELRGYRYIMFKDKLGLKPGEIKDLMLLEELREDDDKQERKE